jgi:hypothetical protein
MNTHGGKRENSGRKPSKNGQPKNISKSIKVSAEVAEYLREFGTGIVEDVIRKTKSFLQWKINKPQQRKKNAE